jgi:hypothetical protein
MSVPVSQSHSQENRRIDWSAVVRILLLQILILLTISSAIIGYLDWSSEAAWADFIAAGRPSVSDPGPRSESRTPVRFASSQTRRVRES